MSESECFVFAACMGFTFLLLALFSLINFACLAVGYTQISKFKDF